MRTTEQQRSSRVEAEPAEARTGRHRGPDSSEGEQER
ncbi:hypothetical protein BX266_6145 [Streptomyces sp. TLI_171]|nr:hypothetical protein BX266_6145 [Streptomyces sp. TLI_171]